MTALPISKKILSGFLFILVVGMIGAGLAAYCIVTLGSSLTYYQGEFTDTMTTTLELTNGLRDVINLIVPSLEGSADNAEVVRNYANYKAKIDSSVKQLKALLQHKMVVGYSGGMQYAAGFESSLVELFSKCDPYIAKLKKNLPTDADNDEQEIEEEIEEGDTDDEEAEAPLTNTELLHFLREYEAEFLPKCMSLCKGLKGHLLATIKNKNVAVANTMMYALIAIVVVLLLFCIWFYIFIATCIGRPLNNMIEGMLETEKGHLNTRLNFEGSTEFHRLAESFNSMLEGLCQMVSKVLGTSDNLATNSQQLSSASIESAATLKDISKNVNDINNSSLQISNNLEKTSATVDGFSDSIQKVAQLAETAVAAVNITTQAADEGGKTVKKSVDMIGKIKEYVDIATQVILDLNSASLQISEIVNTITAIASQTNLLALNAAIEAARAGEQGKGFTVVAGEVRKLAEESAEAADAISTRIGDILTKTQNAVDSMNLGRGRVDDGIKIIREVALSLDNIIKNVDGVNKKITEISAISSEQSSNSQIMARTIEDITSLTKNTAEQLGVVATAVEQQTTTVSQISDSTEDLASLADELHLLVSRFTISS